MLTVIDEGDGERVLTARIGEATIDAELISALGSVLDDVEHGEIENFVLLFSGDAELGHRRVPIVATRSGPERHAVFRPLG